MFYFNSCEVWNVWYLLWGNCQVTSNGAEGSWSVSHIPRLSPDCDISGPGAGAAPPPAPAPRCHWVSVGSGECQQEEPDTDRQGPVLPGHGSIIPWYRWPCSLNWNIGIEKISKMCLNHHQKNQGKKFGFIWCLDLIENSMKRANPGIYQGKACHNVLSFDVKQRCSIFFSIIQIQWITAEALFDNRMMLVTWQVNINDREVQINKLHLDSTKLGSVYGWSVNVRSSECWELFRCYWITSVDISPMRMPGCSMLYFSVKINTASNCRPSCVLYIFLKLLI